MFSPKLKAEHYWDQNLLEQFITLDQLKLKVV
jgi:hypothetical protein